MKEKTAPETLQEAITFFSDPKVAHEFMCSVLWPDSNVKCAHCGSNDVGKFSGKRMTSNCKSCKRQFTVKIGTIFADSPLPLSKWLPAVWLITNAKNGISSYEIGRSLGVTQKTGWFMLHRIRLALQNKSLVKIHGQVEVDETWIGGKSRNMHADKRRAKGIHRQGQRAMTPVQGLLQRHKGSTSKIILKQLKSTHLSEIIPGVREYVLKGSEVFTDALPGYKRLNNDYVHQVIDHAVCYAKGKVHINGLENFWSLLKRGIRGTYVSVEPFHLFRYLDEQAFRFNEREHNDAERFLKAIRGIIGKSLTYAKLTGKDEAEGGLMPA